MNHATGDVEFPARYVASDLYMLRIGWTDLQSSKTQPLSKYQRFVSCPPLFIRVNVSGNVYKDAIGLSSSRETTH
jgi:hypothetical protein